MEALDRLPLVAEQLIRPIPRLEEIREIFKAQTRPFGLAGDQALPPEARVLRVAVDYELLESQGMTADLALATLRGRGGRYDPRVIDALARIMGNEDVRQTIRELELDTIEPGMVFAEDVRTASGTLLVARGYAVTYALVERLRGLPPGHTHGPVRMIVDPAPGDPPGGTDAGNARAAGRRSAGGSQLIPSAWLGLPLPDDLARRRVSAVVARAASGTPCQIRGRRGTHPLPHRRTARRFQDHRSTGLPACRHAAGRVPRRRSRPMAPQLPARRRHRCRPA